MPQMRNSKAYSRLARSRSSRSTLGAIPIPRSLTPRTPRSSAAHVSRSCRGTTTSGVTRAVSATSSNLLQAKASGALTSRLYQVVMEKKTIRDIDISGKRVFIRVDFNVPVKSGEIADDTRILGAMPTIKYAIDQGAKVILASHLG